MVRNEIKWNKHSVDEISFIKRKINQQLALWNIRSVCHSLGIGSNGLAILRASQKSENSVILGNSMSIANSAWAMELS